MGVLGTETFQTFPCRQHERRAPQQRSVDRENHLSDTTPDAFLHRKIQPYRARVPPQVQRIISTTKSTMWPSGQDYFLTLLMLCYSPAVELPLNAYSFPMKRSFSSSVEPPIAAAKLVYHRAPLE